jgi:branched-chain amino acid transport system substrate-binding protein
MTMKKVIRLVVISMILFAMVTPVWAQGQTEQGNPEEFVLGFMSSLSGSFAAVAETQQKGVELAVAQVNENGGLDMPWGKVPVRIISKDDEAKLDVGVRRYRELRDAGIDGIVGTIWNPMAGAINEEAKMDPIPYIASCVPAMDTFVKGNPAKGTFSVAFTPWSIGYLAGSSAVKNLGAETFYYVERSDSWGATILQGLRAALEEHGGEIIGIAQYPNGNTDFSSAINEAKSMKPDVFLASQFAGDAIALFKQAYDMGLTDVTIPFNAFITNVVAKGIPSAARSKIYGLSYYYYGMEGFEDQELVEKAKKFTADHEAMFNEPPDAYGAIAYNATQMMLAAVEEAGTFDVDAVSEVLAGKTFDTIKGESTFREDHELVGDYLAFMVKGKSAQESTGEWDVFTVEGYFGGEAALPPLEMLGY